MKIFHVVTLNKSVVYFLSFIKECILDLGLLTLFYERLIITISCYRGKQLAEWVDVKDKLNFRTGCIEQNLLWLYVHTGQSS